MEESNPYQYTDIKTLQSLIKTPEEKRAFDKALETYVTLVIGNPVKSFPYPK